MLGSLECLSPELERLIRVQVGGQKLAELSRQVRTLQSQYGTPAKQSGGGWGGCPKLTQGPWSLPHPPAPLHSRLEINFPFHWEGLPVTVRLSSPWLPALVRYTCSNDSWEKPGQREPEPTVLMLFAKHRRRVTQVCLKATLRI